jgi:hypothetical protein
LQQLFPQLARKQFSWRTSNVNPTRLFLTELHDAENLMRAEWGLRMARFGATLELERAPSLQDQRLFFVKPLGARKHIRHRHTPNVHHAP